MSSFFLDGKMLVKSLVLPIFAFQRRSVAIFSKKDLIFFGSDSFSIEIFRELLLLNRSKIDSIQACVVSKQVLFAKFLNKNHKDVKIHVWPELPKVDPKKTEQFALVASFGKLIPPDFIDKLPNRIINIHPSLLPRWRGAAPLPRCIMAGDMVVGVSVVEVVANKFDVGRVLAQQEFVSVGEMRIDQLSRVLGIAGVKLLVQKVLPELDSSFALAWKQSNLPYKSSLARRLKHSDLYIDWATKSAIEILRLFAATLSTDHHHKTPTGQLRTAFGGHIVRIVNVDPTPALDEITSMHTSPGRIIFDMKHKDRLLVKTKRGWVIITKLIYKKPMSPADFYNGYLSKRPESQHFFDDVCDIKISEQEKMKIHA